MVDLDADSQSIFVEVIELMCCSYCFQWLSV